MKAYFRIACWCTVLLVVVGCESVSSGRLGSVLGALGAGGGGLSSERVVAGLKEALQVGTQRAVAKTSQPGGYLENPGIRIEIPEKLQGMADALRTVGMGAQVDRFEAKMNEAAELAAKEAAPVFLDAIREMTFADAKQILEGGDTAATDYFRAKTSQTLKSRYAPVIESQMARLGIVKMYTDLQSRYNAIPLVPKVTASLDDYVADQALNGLFAVLGQEEKKIREDPAARTTELLRRVFGSK